MLIFVFHFIGVIKYLVTDLKYHMHISSHFTKDEYS